MIPNFKIVLRIHVVFCLPKPLGLERGCWWPPNPIVPRPHGLTVTICTLEVPAQRLKATKALALKDWKKCWDTKKKCYFGFGNFIPTTVYTGIYV